MKCTYPTHYKRMMEARKYLKAVSEQKKLDFLDFGGGNNGTGVLFKGDTSFREFFDEHFNYFNLDLKSERENTIIADACDPDLLEKSPNLLERFDVIYSSDTFEHLHHPFLAATNFYKMLKHGGIGLVFTPFSWRYHEVPIDHFRFSHTSLVYLFEINGEIDVLESGYDITQRRQNIQGKGFHKGFNQNDVCPEDELGAWRENWRSLIIFRKTGRTL